MYGVQVLRLVSTEPSSRVNRPRPSRRRLRATSAQTPSHPGSRRRASLCREALSVRTPRSLQRRLPSPRRVRCTAPSTPTTVHHQPLPHARSSHTCPASLPPVPLFDEVLDAEPLLTARRQVLHLDDLVPPLQRHDGLQPEHVAIPQVVEHRVALAVCAPA